VSRFQDYYQTLGLSRSASADEIKRAYRKLAKEWHPDRHPAAERDAVEQKFKAIAEAHEVLSDRQKRERYDSLGANWRQGQDFQGAGGIDPAQFARMFGGAGAGMGGGGFSDFFAQMFGDMFTGGAAGRGGPRAPQRGADAEAEVKLSLGEALIGGKRALAFRTRVTCQACGGSGRLGAGACPACGGLGATTEDKNIELTIPDDVRDGQVVRLRGLGQDGAAGPGDLLLKLQVVDDDVYRLRGRGDVEADVEIAPWDILADTTVDVAVRGGTATAKIPAGTQAGQKLRLRGQGLHRKEGGRGDLVLIVRFSLPADMSEDQRALLKHLAMTSKPVRGGAARGGSAGSGVDAAGLR